MRFFGLVAAELWAALWISAVPVYFEAVVRNPVWGAASDGYNSSVGVAEPTLARILQLNAFMVPQSVVLKNAMAIHYFHIRSTDVCSGLGPIHAKEGEDDNEYGNAAPHHTGLFI